MCSCTYTTYTMKSMIPVQHPLPVHEDASALRPSVQHAVGQALATAAANIHHALRLAPVEGVLQADLTAPQAELGEVCHGLLEVVCKGLIALLLIILHTSGTIRTQASAEKPARLTSRESKFAAT